MGFLSFFDFFWGNIYCWLYGNAVYYLCGVSLVLSSFFPAALAGSSFLSEV